MRFLIFGLLILYFAGQSNAQIKKEMISTATIGPLSCEYYKKINLEKGSVDTYVSLRFQNARYSNITDNVSIGFFIKKRNSKFLAFIVDLKAALKEMGSKSILAWHREDYIIKLNDFSDDMFLYEPYIDGSGYTILSRNYVEKLIEWLESLGLK